MAQTINLAEKYSDQLQQAFLRSSVIQSNVNNDFSFEGVRGIYIYSVVTQPLNDYTRSGVWRYGTPTELEDDVQHLVLSQDKSFAMTVDKGNNKDQMNAKRAGRVVKQQVGEQVVPWFDKYALGQWSTAAKELEVGELTKNNVVDMFASARSQFVNDNIPMSEQCIAYVPTTTYTKLLLNPEFISVDKLGEKNLVKGEVGKCMNWRVIEIPDTYLDSDVFALFTHKSKVLAPTKISELFIRNDVPGISGTLIEGRYYGDAFALKTLVNSTEYDSDHPEGEGSFEVVGVLKAVEESTN